MILVSRTIQNLGYNASDVEFITSSISTWCPKISMIVNSIVLGMTMSLIPNIVADYTEKKYMALNNKINKALQIILFISIPSTCIPFSASLFKSNICLKFLLSKIDNLTFFSNTNSPSLHLSKSIIFFALFFIIFNKIDFVVLTSNFSITLEEEIFSLELPLSKIDLILDKYSLSIFPSS